MNPDFKQAYDELVEKVRRGEVSKEELSEQVAKLLKPREIDPDHFAKERHQEIGKRRDSVLQRLMDEES